MTWLLPFPLVSAGLFVLWLVLNQTVSAGHVLLGILAGLGVIVAWVRSWTRGTSWLARMKYTALVFACGVFAWFVLHWNVLVWNLDF